MSTTTFSPAILEVTDGNAAVAAATVGGAGGTHAADNAAPQTAPLLQLKDITISIGEQTLLSHVNLHVAAGESIAICGPSGSGKSTLLKAIAHLLPVVPPTKMADDTTTLTSANHACGAATAAIATANATATATANDTATATTVVNGAHAADSTHATMAPQHLRLLQHFRSWWRLGYLGWEWPHTLTLDPHTAQCFTVTGQMLFHKQELNGLHARQWQQIRGQQLGFMMQNAGENFDERQNVIRHFIEAVHAHDKSVPVRTIKEEALNLLYHMHFAYPERILNQYSYEFSLGMCQRLALALTLILKPQLILADEFTSALDICTRVEVLRLIKELQRTYGFALLFITHSPQEAQFMANRIYTIKNGAIRVTKARPTPLPESKIG